MEYTITQGFDGGYALYKDKYCKCSLHLIGVFRELETAQRVTEFLSDDDNSEQGLWQKDSAGNWGVL